VEGGRGRIKGKGWRIRVVTIILGMGDGGWGIGDWGENNKKTLNWKKSGNGLNIKLAYL